MIRVTRAEDRPRTREEWLLETLRLLGKDWRAETACTDTRMETSYASVRLTNDSGDQVDVHWLKTMPAAVREQVIAELGADAVGAEEQTAVMEGPR